MVMEKQLTLGRFAKVAAAKRLAAGESKKWNDLSKEERSARIKAVGDKVTDEDKQTGLKALARAKAKEQGLDWTKLTQEQRQSIIRGARESERSRRQG
jgi:hypothetical protein